MMGQRHSGLAPTNLPPQQRCYFVFHHLFLLYFFCLCLIVHAAPAHAANQQPLRIAITPCTDIIKTFKIFQPLVHYLEGRLHRPFQLVIPKDFYEFEELVRSTQVDFAYQAPHTYVRLAELYQNKPLLKALTPEGESRHRGVILVRKESPIKSLADLKGKVVMFGSELSTAKCLATKILLREHQIDIDRDLQRYIHNGSCESIALNVYLGAVDAGAVCDYSFEDINDPEEPTESDIPAQQFRIIAETVAIPTWVFTALHTTDRDLTARVFAALRQLDRHNQQHRHILEAAEIGGFTPATDTDFDQIRELAKGMQ